MKMIHGLCLRFTSWFLHFVNLLRTRSMSLDATHPCDRLQNCSIYFSFIIRYPKFFVGIGRSMIPFTFSLQHPFSLSPSIFSSYPQLLYFHPNLVRWVLLKDTEWVKMIKSFFHIPMDIFSLTKFHHLNFSSSHPYYKSFPRPRIWIFLFISHAYERTNK